MGSAAHTLGHGNGAGCADGGSVMRGVQAIHEAESSPHHQRDHVKLQRHKPGYANSYVLT
jgi:hypothetical protein